ncbi:hypothetical protein BJY59DRAFT_690088 [Rhodotorula toruloides]
MYRSSLESNRRRVRRRVFESRRVGGGGGDRDRLFVVLVAFTGRRVLLLFVPHTSVLVSRLNLAAAVSWLRLVLVGQSLDRQRVKLCGHSEERVCAREDVVAEGAEESEVAVRSRSRCGWVVCDGLQCHASLGVPAVLFESVARVREVSG